MDGCCLGKIPLYTAIGLLLGLSFAEPVAAHGWYSTTTDPETGVGCCGGTDCKEISDNDVREKVGGYLYLPSGEFIPASRVQQSKDWRFHRCVYLNDFIQYGRKHKAGETRCFFAPPGSF